VRWLNESVVLDEEAAAIIGRDMRVVAEADGVLHARELSLIDAYVHELPVSDPVGYEAIVSGDLGTTYLRSLVMVALADGKISEEEHSVIIELCANVGLSASEVDEAIAEAKKEFLSIFSGLKLFRDSMRNVGQDLGLSETDIDDLWD
jgi:uncharacterized membrane protein YebE (DUF533 family)